MSSSTDWLPSVAAGANCNTGMANNAWAVRASFGIHCGGALTASTNRPASMKNTASSPRDSTVMIASVAKMPHRSGSAPFVERDSLYAAMAMMPITAAPIP